MADKSRIAYILGAGFSKPLGGPLLKDLFSPASFGQAMLAYRSACRELADHAEDVQRVYAYGTAYRMPSVRPSDAAEAEGGLQLWEDAESFLSYLDAARENPILAPALDRALWRLRDSADPLCSIPVLLSAAKRLLAAECSRFLSHANVAAEAWGPYKQWCTALDDRDTIVTFNYDRVLEVAGPAQMSSIVNPTDVDAELPRYFKLHGSVDWALTRDGGRSVIRKSPDHALIGPILEYAMGYPGESKDTFVKDIRLIWKAACDEIARADAIVFIGYRFPPSDARAKTELLDAIRRNPSQTLHVHTVLGPDMDAASVRLVELLTEVCRQSNRRALTAHTAHLKTHRIVQHRLYSDDFLAVFHRDSLTSG